MRIIPFYNWIPAVLSMMSKWREGEMIHLSWWMIRRRERVRLKGYIKKHKLREAPSSVPGPPSSNNWEQWASGGERAERRVWCWFSCSFSFLGNLCCFGGFTYGCKCNHVHLAVLYIRYSPFLQTPNAPESKFVAHIEITFSLQFCLQLQVISQFLIVSDYFI